MEPQADPQVSQPRELAKATAPPTISFLHDFFPLLEEGSVKVREPARPIEKPQRRGRIKIRISVVIV